MTRIIRGLFPATFFLLAAMILSWYALFSYQVGSRNVEFALAHPSADWFPIVWFWKGNKAYFLDLDPARAIADYRRAIIADPAQIDAWLALARTEIAENNGAEARRIAAILAPIIAQSTRWKWQELLLANDLKDDLYFTRCFNFILERMPARRREAILVARQYWNNWASVSSHVEDANLAVWLRYLMSLREVDTAFSAWQRLTQSAQPADEKLALRFCNFLIGMNKFAEAKEVWANIVGPKAPLVYNGGFEQEPMGGGFAWRISHRSSVDISRTAITSFKGAYSLRLRFSGTDNVNFYHVYQFVPVIPNHRYHLVFARKARNLTTDQGVFLEVLGRHCKGLAIRSQPVSGTDRWRLEELDFTVPDGCETILLRVRRRESLRFDNKISGQYWLDNIRLTETP